MTCKRCSVRFDADHDCHRQTTDRQNCHSYYNYRSLHERRPVKVKMTNSKEVVCDLSMMIFDDPCFSLQMFTTAGLSSPQSVPYH